MEPRDTQWYSLLKYNFVTHETLEKRGPVQGRERAQQLVAALSNALSREGGQPGIQWFYEPASKPPPRGARSRRKLPQKRLSRRRNRR